MKEKPDRPLCRRKEQHFESEPPVFNPEFDSAEWKLFEPKEWRLAASLVEHAFPVYPGQFVDIINHLTPTEVWTRMGSEIRFVWNSSSSRETLEFIRPTFALRVPRGIEFVFTTEIADRVAVHLHDITQNLIVRQRVSDEDFADQPPFKCPPMLLFIQEELRHFHDIHVLMAVMRRGFGTAPVAYQKLINTVWVG